MTLRDDMICEKMRSPKEIRKALADLIRLQRKNLRQNDLGYLATRQKYQTNNIVWKLREVLEWTLRHEESPQGYYRRVYGREWPET